MKKIFFIAALFGALLSATSCSDILDTKSDRNVYDPSLSEKTDSMFYTLGILKGVQQVIDQNVLINEMRGDLTATNSNTETALRQLANFSATTTNKYDSAYLYYRIINNCNYYIAHRDTTLLTGSRKVSMPEYVEAKAIRAWAYIQLAKNYGKVPFYTQPVTSISEANKNYPELDIQGICDELAPDLAQYAGYATPTYGDNQSIGSTNSGSTKEVNYSKVMFPVDLVLGDLYLETNQYEKAAKSYFNYIKLHRITSREWYVARAQMNLMGSSSVPRDFRWPTSGTNWTSNFSMDPVGCITYVPMAVNKLYGTVTNLPKLFGYDYYAVPKTSTSTSISQYLETREIDPSDTYINLNASQEYYYYPSTSQTKDVVNAVALGDFRRYGTLISITKNDSSFYSVNKYQQANIYIYREATVYLRLAEALNRAGYPDAAFAILKDGISVDAMENATYVKQATIQYLTTTIPFLSDENKTLFATSYGIHGAGCGITEGAFSPYQMDNIVGEKIQAISDKYGVQSTGTINDTINAVEDLICDEYALELAYEGTRFGDLTRLARHKNAAGLYSTDFGNTWLAAKLAYKHPVVDLKQESNWYLPLK